MKRTIHCGILLVANFLVFSTYPRETFNSLSYKSKRFDQRTPFPTQANRIVAFAGADKAMRKEIAHKANNVRSIVHVSVMMLLNQFLEYKRIYGSTIEKKLYCSMNERQFIDRLLIKRPLMFMTESDLFLLRNGVTGSGGFEAIGTCAEAHDLLLKDYLSYDEMCLAALLGVSVPTFFINNGDRSNRGLVGKKGTFEEEGIYVGLVGARFEKQGFMEWQHMIITPEQNNAAHGYGPDADRNDPKTKLISLWADFYGEQFSTFEQAKQDTSERYIALGAHAYFDSVVYKKRMRMVIEPFLLDAHERGKKENRKVYCHAVGLGLGVWQKTPIQAKLMLEVYADILNERDLSHIADLNFSYFPVAYASCGGVGNGALFRTVHNTIMIHFSKRNPADTLVGKDAGKLLVCMYAWDGNSYPGNEYWSGNLTGSGDPAAACCSLIAELQNPLINSNVSSRNLFIFTSRI